MTREEIVKKIIDLTLDQVREQGWDLLDAMENEQPDMVYNAIKEDVDELFDEDDEEEDYNDGWRNWNPRDLIGDDEDPGDEDR
jgi:hypothetical protein